MSRSLCFQTISDQNIDQVFTFTLLSIHLDCIFLPDGGKCFWIFRKLEVLEVQYCLSYSWVTLDFPVIPESWIGDGNLGPTCLLQRIAPSLFFQCVDSFSIGVTCSWGMAEVGHLWSFPRGWVMCDLLCNPTKYLIMWHKGKSVMVHKEPSKYPNFW